MTNQPKAEKNIFKEQIQTTICSGSRFQMKSVIYVGKVVAHSINAPPKIFLVRCICFGFKLKKLLSFDLPLNLRLNVIFAGFFIA